MKSTAVPSSLLFAASFSSRATTTLAFSAAYIPRTRRSIATTPSPSTSSSMLRATLTRDELSTMGREEQLQLLLGGGENSDERLALGIDPDEVLEFVGTRGDLIVKFQNDIPAFSPEEVVAEVDKFLLDGEMLDLMIKYGQRKREDPSWEPKYAEEDDSPFTAIVNFVSQYAIWIVGGILVKDIVVGIINRNSGGG